ncbi:hypothetical protein DKX38_010742 [Salix brachista]|uniref:Major facilitator superfamily (MFS) profile domain-containing protein n=1 Tax=Salix brachista TaxID=2182728 RepID=A0A5N5MGV0_9ROSI|nr:hypothetical protein DKX38_010742 [Salix brachista]
MDPLETRELVKKSPTDSSKKDDGQSSETCSRTSPLCIFMELFQWLQMLSSQLNPTFIFGVVVVYGLSQGLSGSFFKVFTDYYWKDVQKVQPSAVQLYMGLYYIPWVMKPIWGLFTDVFPVRGYKRRPYFIVAGVLGCVSAMLIALLGKVPIAVALSCLIGMTAGVAIADVTIDACIAKNSIEIRALAPDMQSLCGFCSSVGALIGYSSSGFFVHHLGPQAVPPVLLIVLGFVIYEVRSTSLQSEKKKGAESKGVEDKEIRNERENREDKSGNEENNTIKATGGQLGLKETRSVRDPRGKKVGRINGAGPREGKKEEWAGFRQPNTGANGLGPGRKDKGKEKAECSMGQLHLNKNHQNVTEVTREILQPEHMQISTPANNSLIGGVPVLSQPMERDLGPEPPDEVARMDAMEDLQMALRGMSKTIKLPQVWKPSLFMYLSLALSISTHEGHFYWYTDPKAGPAFSQEFVGIIYAVGALASIAGVLIYQKALKNYPFRSLLLYAQILYGVSGMLDLTFVLRWNLAIGIPDYFFVIAEECVTRIVSRIRWMPMIVLSTRLCPLGIEGTFFALLMCIDSLGSLSSKWGGAVFLHLFHVTRSDFTNLWLVILIRNVLRFATLGLIFLVPRGDQADNLIPPDILTANSAASLGDDGLELVPVKETSEEVHLLIDENHVQKF